MLKLMDKKILTIALSFFFFFGGGGGLNWTYDIAKLDKTTINQFTLFRLSQYVSLKQILLYNAMVNVLTFLMLIA